jgi:DNA mismatch endonuclease, patch repair protein
MRSNRAAKTNPELVLATILRKKIVPNTLPGRPDIVYGRQKLAIFVHGCFWHRCPIHGRSTPKSHTAFWKRKFARNVERDKLNREELESNGWTVLEVWEHEIREDPVGIVRKIRDLVVQNRLPRED